MDTMPEKLVGKYMQAVRQPLGTGRKTHIYTVEEVKTSEKLGTILWYGAWRSYCFIPEDATIYDKGCLKQLSDWCVMLTDAYRKEA
jgi:hypothetical protein